MQTITTPRGSVIIATREDAEKNGLKFSITSSTEAQPFVTSNFSLEGVNIGGRTATSALVKKFVAEAEKMGCSIEGQI
jgi:hypothetical protein